MLSYRTFPLLACVTLLVSLACVSVSRAESTDSARPAGPEIGGVVAAPAATTGSLRGIVKFSGERRPPRPLDVAMDKHCATNAKPLVNESYVWGDNDTLQNVLVYVSKGLPQTQSKTDVPTDPVILDQKGCRFEPHVLTVRTGQPLVLRNGDDTLHNIRSLAKTNDTFNLGQPTLGHRHQVVFTKPELGVPIKCDVHPWMSAFVHVFDHPFFALTQQAGTFEIRGLPPGDYEITPWHELPAFRSDQPAYQVKIEAGKTTELTITYAPRGARPANPNEPRP